MTDSWNLPPGVTPPMIPGNSSRDEWLEKQMEKIEMELDKLPRWLSDVILSSRHTVGDFDTIAKICGWLYEFGVGDLHTEQLHNALPAIEEARNLAQQVEEGHPPEQEYDREDDTPEDDYVPN